MTGFSRILLTLISLGIVIGVLWNSPQEAPANNDDAPDEVMQSPLALDIREADSLASRGAYLAALDRYRNIAVALDDSLALNENVAAWIEYRIGRMLWLSDQPGAANAQFDSIRTRYSDNRWAQKASHDRAHAFVTQERFREALPLFLEALRNARGPEAGRIAFRIGHAHHRLREWQKAAEWYERSVEAFPIIGDYALYRATTCLVNANDKEASGRLLARLISEYPHSPYRVEASVELARMQMADGRHGAAIDQMENVLTSSPHLSHADSAALHAQMGDVYSSGDESKRALEAYTVVLSQFNDTEMARQMLPSYERLKTSAGSPWSKEEQLWRGYVNLGGGEYGRAVKGLSALIDGSDAEPVLPEALYHYSRAQYLSRQYAEAEGRFRTFVVRYPDHPLASQASFHIARALWARKRYNDAVEAYLSFAAEYPETDEAPEALLYVARRYESQGRLSDSAAQYARMASLYPGHRSVGKAYWQAGYNYYRAKKYDLATYAFLELPKRHAMSYLAPKSNYWAAKSAEKSGDKVKARALYTQVKERYPSSYYSFQADLRRSRLDGQPVNPILTGWAGSSDPSRLVPPPVDVVSLSRSFLFADSVNAGSRSERLHLDRTEALLDVWLRTEAEKEADKARQSESGNPAVLAETAKMYFERRLYREGIRAADRLERTIQEASGDATISPALIFPAPFWSHVTETARKNDIDPLFLLAVIRQESRFDQWISSWAGAHGLMQLMPSTAKETARQMRMRDYSVGRLKEPQVSIAIGTHYMSRLLKRFGGNPELALAGYNGGPTRIARWARQRGTRDIDEFVERISMDETRDFVRLVMENYAHYTSLFGNRSTVTPADPTTQ